MLLARPSCRRLFLTCLCLFLVVSCRFKYSYVETVDKYPRVYVYPLPKELGPHSFNFEENITWPVHAYNYHYNEQYFWSALLESESVVEDPSEADLFFIPHIATVLYMHGSKGSGVHNTTLCQQYFYDTFEHISKNYPYYNASAGLDHFFVFAHDALRVIGVDGRSDPRLPQSFPNVVMVTNQGESGGSHNLHPQVDFLPWRDISMMPLTHKMSLHPAESSLPVAERYLFVFRGAILHNEPLYSDNVRQTLHLMYGNRTDVIFGEGSQKYAEEMGRAKFCLFITGWFVWSGRISTIIENNCIPVIISDGYVLPFSDRIDWTGFSLIISERDAVKPNYLIDTLSSIDTYQYDLLRTKLQVARTMLTYNFPPKPKDAFHQVLISLKARQWPKRLLPYY